MLVCSTGTGGLSCIPIPHLIHSFSSPTTDLVRDPVTDPTWSQTAYAGLGPQRVVLGGGYLG